jgi:hypothetical protein
MSRQARCHRRSEQGRHRPDGHGEDEQIGVRNGFLQVTGGKIQAGELRGFHSFGSPYPQPDIGFFPQSERRGTAEQAAAEDADFLESLTHKKDRIQGLGPGRGKVRVVGFGESLRHAEILFLGGRVGGILDKRAAGDVADIYELVVIRAENEAFLAGNGICESVIAAGLLDGLVGRCGGGGFLRSFLGDIGGRFGFHLLLILLHSVALVLDLLLILAGDGFILLGRTFGALFVRVRVSGGAGKAADERQDGKKSGFHGGDWGSEL